MTLSLDDIRLGTLFLSPMAGITDSVFRRLCRSMGADALYTGFVSSDGVIRDNRRTLQMLRFDEEERPIAIQLFGSSPEVIAQAACRAWEMRPDFIDINFGCPARKVTRKLAGCAILKDLGIYREVVSAVVESVPCPVTVKIRAGWDGSNLVYMDAARIAAEEGARAVALHPRTCVQGYSGQADWSMIGQLVRESPVPVIGSGDLFQPQDVRKMIEETGCAAVMIARGAIGNPWIFKRTKAYLETGVLPSEPSVGERLDFALLHASLNVKEKGQGRGMREIRRHMSNYTRGLWCGSRLRHVILKTESLDTMEALVAEYLEKFSQYEKGDPVTYTPLLPADKEQVGART